MLQKQQLASRVKKKAASSGGPNATLPRGGPVCGLEEVCPPFSTLPCNSPSRPWPDGFQMLCSQQRSSAPPKATALASS